MNYFLIELHNRDGDKEYYDHVPIKSEMTNEDLKANKDFWKECILAWNFHWMSKMTLMIGGRTCVLFVCVVGAYFLWKSMKY